jgi:hypothetical protein
MAGMPSWAVAVVHILRMDTLKRSGAHQSAAVPVVLPS